MYLVTLHLDPRRVHVNHETARVLVHHLPLLRPVVSSRGFWSRRGGFTEDKVVAVWALDELGVQPVGFQRRPAVRGEVGQAEGQLDAAKREIREDLLTPHELQPRHRE